MALGASRLLETAPQFWATCIGSRLVCRLGLAAMAVEQVARSLLFGLVACLVGLAATEQHAVLIGGLAGLCTRLLLAELPEVDDVGHLLAPAHLLLAPGLLLAESVERHHFGALAGVGCRGQRRLGRRFLLAALIGLLRGLGRCLGGRRLRL